MHTGKLTFPDSGDASACCWESSLAHCSAVSAWTGFSMQMTSVRCANTLSNAASFRLSRFLAVTFHAKESRREPLTLSAAVLRISWKECFLPATFDESIPPSTDLTFAAS